MFWFEQFYALFTSLMVSAILLLGGSASISALTGMDIRAATMLLPTGVIAFVVVGGLRSTFISDFVVSKTHSNRILHLLTHAHLFIDPAYHYSIRDYMALCVHCKYDRSFSFHVLDGL